MTFLWYELGSLFEDLAEAGMLFDGRAWEFIVGLVIDSVRNTVHAFLWPVHVLRVEPPLGAIALGVAFAVFPRWVKPHVERWLFGDEQATPTKADNEP